MNKENETLYWYQQNWFRNLVVGSFVVTVGVLYFFLLVIVPIIASDVMDIYVEVKQEVAKYCGFAEKEIEPDTARYGL